MRSVDVLKEQFKNENKENLIRFLLKQILEGDVIIATEVNHEDKPDVAVQEGPGLSTNKKIFFRQLSPDEDVNQDVKISLITLNQWKKMKNNNMYTNQLDQI